MEGWVSCAEMEAWYTSTSSRYPVGAFIATLYAFFKTEAAPVILMLLPV